MKRIASKTLLTWILPLAIFFAAGVVAAWASDGGESCDVSGGKCCCSASGATENQSDDTPTGPCGSPKSACGCDDGIPTGERSLRAAKPGRLSDDHDLTPVADPGESLAEYADPTGVSAVVANHPDYSTQRYLLNSSFLC